MLVLTRRLGQSILIGEDIEIKVLSFSEFLNKDQIKIGIEAPKHIKILRSELADTK